MGTEQAHRYEEQERLPQVDRYGCDQKMSPFRPCVLSDFTEQTVPAAASVSTKLDDRELADSPDKGVHGSSAASPSLGKVMRLGRVAAACGGTDRLEAMSIIGNDTTWPSRD